MKLHKILSLIKPNSRVPVLVILIIGTILIYMIKSGIIPIFSSLEALILIILFIVIILALCLRYGNIERNNNVLKNEIDQEKSYLSSNELCFLEDNVFLKYDPKNNKYKIKLHKKIYNKSEQPITKIYVRITCNIFPNNLKKAKIYYRKHPIEFSQIQFKAFNNKNTALPYEIEYDQNNNIELYIRLHSGNNGEPLYPKKSCDIYYSYVMSVKHWGEYIERNIRVKTKKCKVVLEFPNNYECYVSGVERSISKNEIPIMPPIKKTTEIDKVRYEWEKDLPSMHTRYRISWKLPL